MSAFNIFGEKSITIVGAEFPDYPSAHAAASDLADLASPDNHVALIGPGDLSAALKFEPESNGIWKTLLRSHIVLGACGLILGCLAAIAAIDGLWPAAAASPTMTLIFFTMMGGFFGMLIAGVITLRPDHDFIVNTLQEALRKHKWAVVVRPLNKRFAQSAMRIMRLHGAKPLRSM